MVRRNKTSPHPFKNDASNGNDNHQDSNEQQLRLLLNELSFWESSSSSPSCGDQDIPHTSAAVSTTNDAISMPPQQKQPLNLFMEHDQQQQQQQQAAVVLLENSPTLQELEAANTWQKAVDPTSGRTYYYDSITRQSQWEKVRRKLVLYLL